MPPRNRNIRIAFRSAENISQQALIIAAGIIVTHSRGSPTQANNANQTGSFGTALTRAQSALDSPVASKRENKRHRIPERT